MRPREAAARSLPDVELTRRQALGALAGGGVALGTAKAIDNVLVGYGALVGTNLVDQSASGDLASLADAGFRPRPGGQARAAGHTMRMREEGVRVHADGARLADRPYAGLREEWAVDLGLPPALAGLAGDLGAIARAEHSFEFHRFEPFLERVAAASPRPLAVDALRRWPVTEPGRVEWLTGADPADPGAVIRGLVEGFREHAYYDVPRYLAGSIQDNVIAGAVDLRAPFREPVDFESLAADGATGMFCYEFTHRSIEALHAVPAAEQTVPVLGARVIDDRHKHVYTAVGSVVRDGDGLSVPMTFLDYTHTTLYDDLGLRGVLGEGLEAYNDRHRATAVHWSPF